MTKVMRLSRMLTSNCWPQCVVCPCPRAIYMHKIMKKCAENRRAELFFETCNQWSKWWLFCFHKKNCPYQNLYQVVVCSCPGAFFKWWPWVDLDHFYDRVKFVSWSFCTAYTAFSAMYFQVCSNAAYLQHSGERYRTNGPLVRFRHWKDLVNKVSGEPLELGSYLAYRLCARCRWPD